MHRATVWNAQCGARLIRTNGEGPTDTITRAELSAISYTVEHLLRRGEAETIFTDSQAVIHLLCRAVREPHTLRGHLHVQILLDTARLLVERANGGCHTSILKVPAHSGVHGNEQADAAAKQASDPNAEHDHIMPAHHPFGGQWQPAFYKPPPAGQEGPVAPRAVSNLNTALDRLAELRKAVHASTMLGGSKKGIYATVTAQMYDGRDGDRALGKESNAFWHSQRVPWPAAVTLLKHRFDQTWTKKTVFQSLDALSRRLLAPGLGFGQFQRLRWRRAAYQRRAPPRLGGASAPPPDSSAAAASRRSPGDQRSRDADWA
eukprot:scaffold27.g6003.t1